MGRSPIDEAWKCFCAREDKRKIGEITKVIKSNPPEEAAKKLYGMAYQWKI